PRAALLLVQLEHLLEGLPVGVAERKREPLALDALELLVPSDPDEGSLEVDHRGTCQRRPGASVSSLLMRSTADWDVFSRHPRGGTCRPSPSPTPAGRASCAA